MYELKSAFADISKIMKQCEQSDLTSFVYKDSRLSIQFSKVVSEEVLPIRKKREAPELSLKPEFLEAQELVKEELTSTEETIDVVSPFVGTVIFCNQIKGAAEDTAFKKGDVLCSIEAMKIYNDIKAPVSGRIVGIFVKDSSLVEFEQLIFKIKVDKDDETI